MNRNLHRRIEVCFPVQEDQMKQDILSILRLQWEDDEKGVWLNSKMVNKRPKTALGIRAQMATYEYLRTQYG